MTMTSRAIVQHPAGPQSEKSPAARRLWLAPKRAAKLSRKSHVITLPLICCKAQSKARGTSSDHCGAQRSSVTRPNLRPHSLKVRSEVQGSSSRSIANKA